MPMNENNHPAVISLNVEDKAMPKVKTSMFATTDAGVLYLSLSIIPKWRESGFTSRVMTVDRFADITAVYQVKLAESRKNSADKSPTVIRLHELIDLAKLGLSGVKKQLEIEYGYKMAVAHYASVGAKLNNGTYTYFGGYENIGMGIATTIKGIIQHGYEDTKYGLTFWQELYDEFADLALLNKNLTGGGSSVRGTKNELKEELKIMHKVVTGLLLGNFGKTWKIEARNWGYLRERN